MAGLFFKDHNDLKCMDHVEEREKHLKNRFFSAKFYAKLAKL